MGCKSALSEAGDQGKDLAERRNLEGRRGGVPKGDRGMGQRARRESMGSAAGGRDLGKRQMSR